VGVCLFPAAIPPEHFLGFYRVQTGRIRLLGFDIISSYLVPLVSRWLDGGIETELWRTIDQNLPLLFGFYSSVFIAVLFFGAGEGGQSWGELWRHPMGKSGCY
jgi:O-antigen/teichoic acid export membrane protein